MKSNAQAIQHNPQLQLKFINRPGRPQLGEDRRTTISITITPKLVQAFDRWAYENDLSRSRGVERAMIAVMTGGKDGRDV